MLPGLILHLLALVAPPAEVSELDEYDQVRITRQLERQAEAWSWRWRSVDDTCAARHDEVDAYGFGRMSVQRECDADSPAIGWSGQVGRSRFDDRRTRTAPQPVPSPFVTALRTGTRFVYDVYVGGNPAGTAEAFVGELKDDPLVPGRQLRRLVGRAVTGGVATVVGSLRDDMEAWIDADTGASVQNINTIVRSGLLAPYERRVTVADYAGRGYVRIVDTRDEKRRTTTMRMPENTLDAMGAMAWVRSLDLGSGETATAHGMDGHALLRIDVIARGNQPLAPMPSIGTALGIGPGDLVLLEGMLTQVDGHGEPLTDEPVASFRAWRTTDERRIIVALESDIWLTVLRLVLSRYDPPVDAAVEH